MHNGFKIINLFPLEIILLLARVQRLCIVFLVLQSIFRVTWGPLGDFIY